MPFFFSCFSMCLSLFLLLFRILLFFRRMITVQQSIGQSVLLGCLALSTALLAASSRPFWSLLPAAATVPVAFGWMSIQLRLRRDQRLEQMPGSSRS
jgi:hypothetical protein